MKAAGPARPAPAACSPPRRRLARAQELITKTSRSYADIATECGLASQNHLCLCFKKRFGRTPRSFRPKS